MNSPAKKIYLLDTNILINFALWMPLSLNNVFWAKLAESLKKGEWVLLDVVVNEIVYMPELKKWCGDQKTLGFMQSMAIAEKNRAVAINNQYPMIDPATANSTGDTYLIAFAEANKLVVFSKESPRKNNQALYKIPDVCQALKIPYISRPEIFLKDIGYQN
jgi:hypothetical protein